MKSVPIKNEYWQSEFEELAFFASKLSEINDGSVSLRVDHISVIDNDIDRVVGTFALDDGAYKFIPALDFN